MVVQLTSHAVDRYRERVKPALGRAEAQADLERICDALPSVEPLTRCPIPGHVEDGGVRYLELSPGIVLAGSQRQRRGPFVAHTVLVNATLPPAVRARRAEKRRKRKEQRAWREKRRRDLGLA